MNKDSGNIESFNYMGEDSSGRQACGVNLASQHLPRGGADTTTKRPAIFIKTFGCQMNFRDSEFVMGMLLERGFKKANSLERADIILFNSCSVRKHAEDRLISNISDLKDLKKKRPGLVIGLVGCTAQIYKDKILRRAPLVDFSCGPGNETDLPRIIEDVLKHRCPIVATDKVNEKRPETFPKYRDSKFKAFVSISEGCNNYCSYCIVPYARGRERSRDAKDIVKEVGDLAERGIKEITLLGQNVNSYRKKPVTSNQKPEFVRLLGELNAIKGIERIRFMTSHPKDASIELFKAMRDLDKVCRHLHLPMQSGSNRILKLMNRGYNRKRYLALAESYKKFVPDGSITTDIVVGFPSESRRDFDSTIKLMKEIGFDGAFAFKYSPRPPAKSANMKDDVPKEEKEERLKAVLELQREISRRRNAPLEGKVVEILVDGKGDKAPSVLIGRTRTNKVVVFKGDSKLIGKIVSVKIESIKPHTLFGRLL